MFNSCIRSELPGRRKGEGGKEENYDEEEVNAVTTYRYMEHLIY